MLTFQIEHAQQQAGAQIRLQALGDDRVKALFAPRRAAVRIDAEAKRLGGDQSGRIVYALVDGAAFDALQRVELELTRSVVARVTHHTATLEDVLHLVPRGDGLPWGQRDLRGRVADVGRLVSAGRHHRRRGETNAECHTACEAHDRAAVPHRSGRRSCVLVRSHMVTDVVCTAIRQRTMLRFEYDGKSRLVQPYCHGVSSAGHEVLRAVDVSGRGPGFGFGKLWLLTKMSAVVDTGTAFLPDDPNYNPNDSAMRSIHCRILRT